MRNLFFLILSIYGLNSLPACLKTLQSYLYLLSRNNFKIPPADYTATNRIVKAKKLFHLGFLNPAKNFF